MLMTLTTAALMLSLSDPDAVVSTAPRGEQQVLQASQQQLDASLSEASPSTTVSSAAVATGDGHGLSTADQISRWINQGRAERAPQEQAWADPWTEEGPRKVHGEFSVGFGSGGYREYAAAVDLPIGETGTLSLSVAQTKNAPWGYAYGPYGYWGAGARPFGLSDSYGYSPRLMRSRSLPLDGAELPLSGSSKSASIGLSFGQ